MVESGLFSSEDPPRVGFKPTIRGTRGLRVGHAENWCFVLEVPAEPANICPTPIFLEKVKNDEKKVFCGRFMDLL